MINVELWLRLKTKTMNTWKRWTMHHAGAVYAKYSVWHEVNWQSRHVAAETAPVTNDEDADDVSCTAILTRQNDKVHRNFTSETRHWPANGSAILGRLFVQLPSVWIQVKIDVFVVRLTPIFVSQLGPCVKRNVLDKCWPTSNFVQC